MKFKIGTGSSIHMGCKFNCKSKFSIGENSTINQFCRIDNRGGVYIGNNVSVSPYVKIITADHDLMDKNCIGREFKVVLEDYVFLGSEAMIFPGCTMKYGSALAARSVLTKDTERDYIYMGTPAVKYKKRPGKYLYTASYKRLFH